MKISRVFANNRKKTFVLEAGGKNFEFPFSRLQVKPRVDDPIKNVHVDSELGREGFSYVLKSGKEDSVMMDSVLHYNRDPEYLCELMLHELTIRALTEIKKRDVSKREIARRLRTSPKQVYRLLDPAFYGKTIDQMVKLLHVLGLKVRLKIEKEAA